MLYKRLIWLIRKHPYTAALIYFKKIFHFLTFQTSKLLKTVAKKTKNMTSFPCSVRSADFLPLLVAKDNFFLFHLCRGQFGRGPIDMLVAKWSKCWQSESTCQTLWSLPFSAARTAKQKNAISPLKLLINISSKRV